MNGYHTIHRGDERMESYVAMRMKEEREKLMGVQENIMYKSKSTNHNHHRMVNPLSLLSDSKFALGGELSKVPEEKSLYEMPTHLDLDSLHTNRDIVDKPTQWVTGMMEVPLDAQSKIKNVEQIC